MSKKLETVTGVHVNNQYHSKALDNFSRAILGAFKGDKPIKHSYYELVNKKGKIVQIIDTTQEIVVQSAAHRMGLDYRLVEFNETWEDLDKDDGTKEQ